jgi:hypothetical protein
VKSIPCLANVGVAAPAHEFEILSYSREDDRSRFDAVRLSEIENSELFVSLDGFPRDKKTIPVVTCDHQRVGVTRIVDEAEREEEGLPAAVVLAEERVALFDLAEPFNNSCFLLE